MNKTTAVSKETRPASESAALVPPVDVIEDTGGITLYADLPGVPKERLSLHIDADTLTIEGELGLPLPEGIESTHAEVGLPRYRRSFTLSRELDADKVSASFDNGVLCLRIPKAEHALPRKIEVAVA
ncbi:MAG TPA: Hsp20/alpha crystallin family protein [Azonexus sp.]